MRVIMIDPWINRAFMAALMNFALLWASGRIMRHQIHKWRLVTSAITGGVYQLFLGIRWELGKLYSSEWLIFVLVGALLFVWTCPGKKINQVIRGILLFYFLTFMTVGISMGIFSATQIWGLSELRPWQFMLINLSSLCLVAEIGWGLVHETIWTRTCLLNIRVYFDEEGIDLKTLVDTGNFLRDTISRAPVIIISFAMVEKFLSADLRRFITDMMKGDVPHPEDELKWGSKLRFIPLASVNHRGGMLVGIVPERIEVGGKAENTLESVVVGFSEQRFPEGEYYGLFPGVLLNESLNVMLKEEDSCIAS